MTQEEDQDEPSELDQSKADLVRLHRAICRGLADKAEGEEGLSPQELKEARQLLLDNRIRVDAPGHAKGPRGFIRGLPFREVDQPGGEEYNDAVNL